MNIINKKTKVSDKKVMLVAAEFYNDIAQALIENTRTTLLDQGIDDNHIDLLYVPGAFEIPLAVKKVLLTKHYDAIITLGAVIRGETPHFDYVCAECAKGVARLSIEYNTPVIFAVLTTDNKVQADKRAGIHPENKTHNKGVYAALAAVDMMALSEQI